MTISLKVKHKRNGKFLFALFLGCFISSCDPARNLSLKINHEEATLKKTGKRNVMVLNDNRIMFELSALLVHGWFGEERRKGHQLGIDVKLKSKSDLTFDVSKAYIIDASGKRMLPDLHSSIFRKDGFYKGNKEHGIGIVFYSPDSSYIDLPINLYLPPIYFVRKGDTLNLSKIEIQ